MGEFLFVVKTFAITIVLIFLMQIRVGSGTIEQISLRWMHRSPAVEAMRDVAGGAVTVATQGWEWAKGYYARHFGSLELEKRAAEAPQKVWNKISTRPYSEEVD